MDYLDIADRARPLPGPLMRGHAALYRATGGRIGGRVPGLPPMLLLDHVGRKSGRKRTVPLVYMPDSDDLVLVAAKGGHPQDPAWAHNLRANPKTEVQLESERIAVWAQEVEGEERGRLWPKLVEYNPLWGRYQARTKRMIPVFVLERNE